MKSVFSLVCGILVIVSLYLPWWNFGIEVSGWEVLGETELWWVGNTGPIITLVGGIVLIGCALAALIVTRFRSEAKNVFAVLRILPRIAAFLVVMGAVWYIIDARDSDMRGCGGILPFDWTGFGTWLAIEAGLGGLLVGVTVPSRSKMWRREYGESVSKGSPMTSGVRDYSFHEDRLAGPVRAYGSAKEHFNRASDSQSAGKDSQAVVEYDTAIKLDPNYTLAYFNRGTLLLSQGNKKDAIADFEKVIELSDDPDLAKMARHRINEASVTSDEKESGSVMQGGQLESGEKVPVVDPHSLAKNHFDRACDYEARGDDDRAIQAYTQAIDSDSKYSLAYFNRGSLRLLRGSAPEAITDFEKVLKLSTDDNLTRMAQKRLDEAMATLNQEVSAPELARQSDESTAGDKGSDLGSTARYHFNRARDCESKGDDELAIAAYSQAIVSEPDKAIAYFNRGSLHLLHENKAEAIADFEKVIELSDDDNMVEMAQNRISELNEQEWD